MKEEKDVREDSPPFPLTDYSKYKLACERQLLDVNPRGIERVIARPATVCGYARRLRLDLTVNILTMHALVNRKIRVFGGKQLRPNLQIADMVRAYETLLSAPAEKIDGQAFNIGYQNRSVEELALLVRETIGDPGIAIEHVPTDDGRSYHINSDKIGAVLGFKPEHTIEDAVRDLAEKYRAGSIPDPMTDRRYYNIRTMQALKFI